MTRLTLFKNYPFRSYVVQHRRPYLFGLLWLLTVDAINVAMPLTIREAIDAMGPRHWHGLLWAGVAYFFLMAVQSIGRYYWRIYLIGTSHVIAQSLRLKLYGHLQKLPLRYYQKVRTGDLMSRATNDIESIRMAVGPGVLVTVDALLMFLMIIPVMFWLSPKLAVLAFAFYPSVPWITARLGNKIDFLFESLQAKMSKMSAHAQEIFSAIRLVKSLVLEGRVEKRFQELSREYEEEGILLAKYQAVFSPSLALLTNLGTFLILIIGGRDVIEGAISLGTFVAFQRFVVQLSWPMEAIGWAVTMNKEGAAAQRRLDEILEISEVQSKLGESSRLTEPQPLLKVTDLKYAYGEVGKQEKSFSLALDQLSIERGKKIGVVGPVGAGKTTLFNLLLRLYEPPRGSLFFEGQDVTSLPLKHLRRKVASVEQGVFLFSENLAMNIRMGIAEEVSFEEVRKAADVACITPEIEELAEGFETSLGERGINLSGGQKQRVALARALVRKPTLLLLDDSFSAVDVHIESEIIHNFFDLYPELSVCFASHRLSVMPRMDEIWLLELGQLVDRGSHDELLSRSPLYQSLWEKSERQIQREVFDLPEFTEVAREVSE